MNPCDNHSLLKILLHVSRTSYMTKLQKAKLNLSTLTTTNLTIHEKYKSRRKELEIL